MTTVRFCCSATARHRLITGLRRYADRPSLVARRMASVNACSHISFAWHHSVIQLECTAQGLRSLGLFGKNATTLINNLCLLLPSAALSLVASVNSVKYKPANDEVTASTLIACSVSIWENAKI